MKSLHLCLLLAFVSLVTVHAEPVRVRVLKSDGTRPLGYIHNTNDKGIQFSVTEDDPRPQGLPHSDVKGVSFEEEGDIMGPAYFDYSRERYESAEALFKKIADDYGFLWGITRDQLGNFASDARFFQIDCLRRLGRYSEINGAFDTQTGSNLEDTIDEIHLPTLKLLRIWGQMAAKDWDAVEASLKEYEQPLVGKKAELFTIPNFKDVPPNVAAQLSYIRARLYEAKDRKNDALTEYYGAMTLNYGSDAILARDAMSAALAIQSKLDGVKENYTDQKNIQSLAVLYKEAFNQGELSALYMEYLKEPQMPEALQRQKEEAEKKAQEEKEAAEAEAKAKEAEAMKAKEAEDKPKPNNNKKKP